MRLFLFLGLKELCKAMRSLWDCLVSCIIRHSCSILASISNFGLTFFPLFYRYPIYHGGRLSHESVAFAFSEHVKVRYSS